MKKYRITKTCNCFCGCEQEDDFTIEGWTCEECFRECVVMDCDCKEVCGWTQDHTYKQEGEWLVCSNCGTETQEPNLRDNFISFTCGAHGEQNWIR